MTPAPRSADAVVAAVEQRRSRSALLRRRRRQLLLWLLVAVVVTAIAFGAGLIAAPMDYSFQPPRLQPVLLLDHSGKVVATIRAPQDEQPVAGTDIPQVMKNAVVAAEDDRFFSHRGVDPFAAARALWGDITGGRLQGGSAITEQYVQNVYAGSRQTAARKLREASLAVRLEEHLPKDEILTRYLNTLYLGNGTAGVQAASRFYFGVPVSDLDLDPVTGQRDPALALARAATLAGIAPAPSVWNPIHNPRAARQRELFVLNRMITTGFVSAQQASAAYGDALPPIVAKAMPQPATVAPQFRDMVEQRLEQAFPDSADTTLFARGGTTVTTTLDLGLQQAAERALAEVLPSPHDPEAAIAAVDPRTGDIRAIAQRGAAYQPGGFVVARDLTRSSGSTIEPFTLALALQRGYSVDEPVYAPRCIRITVGYRPCNARNGPTFQTLRSALVGATNTVYAPLAVRLGVADVVRLARRSGMSVEPLAPSDAHPFPSYALGVPTNPLSAAVAYATLVDHGIHHPPNSLLDVRTHDDGPVYDNRAARAANRVLPADVADTVTAVLGQAVSNGTGAAARASSPVFGMTGTTADFTNAWFTGCTRTLCISVWLGYDDEYLRGGTVPHAMRNVEGTRAVTGGTLPAQIFARMLALDPAAAGP